MFPVAVRRPISIASFVHRRIAAATLVGLCLAAAGPAGASPAIRTSPGNAVPACVTPERLTAFLRSRNDDLDPRFVEIARHYKRHGEAWRVRWDYAFFQMAIETNFLTFRAPSGRRGDVDPRQNNFAGIGTTGGGVPGDSYPDVSTGVLAQIQHLVVYSGEPIAEPVAPRTRLKQDAILTLSEPIAARRAVTFQDLAGRWAVDRAYGRSIEWVAEGYRNQHCGREEAMGDPRSAAAAPAGRQVGVATGAAMSGLGASSAWATGVQPPAPPRTRIAEAGQLAVPPPRPAVRPSRPAGAVAGPTAVEANAAALAAAPRMVREQAAERAGAASGPSAVEASGALRAGLGIAPHLAARDAARTATPARPPRPCRVEQASFGGRRTVLIRAETDRELEIYAIRVLDGAEAVMAESFIRSRAPGAAIVAMFDDAQAALARAGEICASDKAR